MICSSYVVVKCKHGIHLRTASRLIAMLKGFKQQVWFQKGTIRVNAKSILSLLMLEARKNVPLHVKVEGPKCNEVVKALKIFFEDVTNCYDYREAI